MHAATNFPDASTLNKNNNNQPPAPVTVRPKKRVALTFDDGPTLADNGITNNVLEVLARHGIQASFFPIADRVETNDAAKRIVSKAHKAGHLIGNHSYSHPSNAFQGLCNLGSKDAVIQDIQRAQTVLQSVTGEIPRFFRAPQGVTACSLFSYQDQEAFTKMGFVTNGRAHGVGATFHMHWDFEDRSWDSGVSEQSVVSTLQSAFHSRMDRMIILSHDSVNDNLHRGLDSALKMLARDPETGVFLNGNGDELQFVTLENLYDLPPPEQPTGIVMRKPVASTLPQRLQEDKSFQDVLSRVMHAASTGSADADGTTTTTTSEGSIPQPPRLSQRNSDRLARAMAAAAAKAAKDNISSPSSLSPDQQLQQQQQQQQPPTPTILPQQRDVTGIADDNDQTPPSPQHGEKSFQDLLWRAKASSSSEPQSPAPAPAPLAEPPAAAAVDEHATATTVSKHEHIARWCNLFCKVADASKLIVKLVQQQAHAVTDRMAAAVVNHCKNVVSTCPTYFPIANANNPDLQDRMDWSPNASTPAMMPAGTTSHLAASIAQATNFTSLVGM